MKSTADNPGYMDPVVLNIPIQPSNDYYYIADEDFLEIDKNILYIRENPETSDGATDVESVEGEPAEDAE